MKTRIGSMELELTVTEFKELFELQKPFKNNTTNKKTIVKHKQTKGRKYQPWKNSEEEALKLYLAKGWSKAKIARTLDRTKTAINIRSSKIRRKEQEVNK